MGSELIPLTFHKIMQSKAYTVIILGTQEKRFAIYTDPHVGRNIQHHLTQKKTRPLTHDLITSLLRGLNLKPLQVVINNLEDTVYFARLFLEQTNGDLKQIFEIDARPSDCITLALIHRIPVLCKKDVFDQTIPI